MGLERIRLLLKANPKLSFYEALEICQAGNIFTTHTPVAAGLERFGFDLIDEHFRYLWKEFGITREEFINLGRENMGTYELYSMAVLAINLSSAANGVARLHGKVSQEMWQWMYPGLPKEEVPIGYVTNGIHVETWTSREMGSLFDRYLDPSWREDPSHEHTCADVDKIPDAELWRTHERRRERLVAFCRERLRQQLINQGASQSVLEEAEEVLNPDALTIGFARRFATYKRATLILRDKARLSKILNNPDRPVQLIFAGKAHPHDIPGKELIREIVNTSRLPEFRQRIVFLENYDMAIGRALTQGVDVWLNNPRRPKEASGTSGMKVIYNGGLNASTLDGWWDEGYDPSLGWAIGKGEEYPESEDELQDTIEGQALYNLLEQDIVPLFYERSGDGLPRKWIPRVKKSIRKMAPFFNPHRMFKEYTEQCYVPAARSFEHLTQPDLTRGIEFAKWKQRLVESWPKVKIIKVETSGSSELKIGSEQEIHAWVDLGDLTPDDVTVQVYFGALDTYGNIQSGHTVEMAPVGPVAPADGAKGANASVWEFMARVAYHSTGQQGISVRVLPCHEDLPSQYQRGIIAWAG